MHESSISREQIAATYALIRPYVRRTPVIEVDSADFGLESHTLACKLELFQHSGSFKARALWRVMRIAAEPGGAAAMAAYLTGAYRARRDERVGVLICGGNTDAVNF